MADQNDLEAAVAAASNEPENQDLWDDLEAIAGELDRPDEVAALYREVLRRELAGEIFDDLGDRAAQFHEEWYAEDPSGLIDVLTRILEVNPRSASAFQRLTVVYTVGERWDELLAVYDRAIDSAGDPARLIRLLDEAAQVAKDVANRTDAAISYLQTLLPLTPDDAKLAANLGRLLERHERWRDLIQLWETNLDSLSEAEREQSRARIATCWLDNLDDPEQALDAVRPLLNESADDTIACGLLERILAADSASAAVRDGALDLLRSHHDSQDRPEEIIRVLEAAIARADADADTAQIQQLHEEAAELLADLGQDVVAMDHYAALLALNPASSVTQEQLRQIAQRTDNFDRYANGVAAAAHACADVSRKVALLAEAGRTRLDVLDDENGAIEIYKSALDQEGIADADVRAVARRLSELLASADRPAERLEVLERLATVETAASRKRGVIGEAARLAESLGETDRALAAWRLRLADDDNDIAALDAMIDLLEDTERWEPLIAALEQRVGKSSGARARHHDLARVAAVYEKELEVSDAAIDAWKRVQSECGEDAESIDALTELLAKADRWAELAELLERVSAPETARVTNRLVHLGTAQLEYLDAPGLALSSYHRALMMDATHESARAGLTGLLENDGLRANAADALANAYRQTQDWPRYLELLAPRLADTEDTTERLQILKEAADIQENRVDDKSAALDSLAQALPLTPRDRILGQNLPRLARETGKWDVAVQAFNEAAMAIAEEPQEVAYWSFESAKILELELDNADDAHSAYFRVIGIQPDNLPAVQGAVRVGTGLRRWAEVAAAVLSYTQLRKVIEESLFTMLESAADEADAWNELVDSVVGAAANVGDLPPRLAFELNYRIAGWHRNKRKDEAATQGALLTALSFDPERPDALRELADLQRSTPNRAFFDTLRRISDVDPKNLDIVDEAARVAVEHLDDRETARTALATLLGRATSAWRGTAEAQGSNPPEHYVAWAIAKLVDHYLELGKTTPAIDMLVDSSRLPFEFETRRAMRHRAAAIAAESGDNGAAIEMYRGVLMQSPQDTETMQKLAVLYEEEGRLAELMTLRRTELDLPESADNRLELRIEVCRLVGEVERAGGRLDLLNANLTDHPGHEATIDGLSALLAEKAQFEQLADMLEAQATKLEDLDETSRAADLWARAAAVAETRLTDIDRAIADYRHVVAVSPNLEASTALARLFIGRSRPEKAVPWLERALEVADADQRNGLVLDLANAHLGADQLDQAIACLESNLPADDLASDLRSLLIDLYRRAERWEPLAALLTSSLELFTNDDDVLSHARESADIYHERLELPEKAIPALTRALAISPDDRGLRIQYAISLRVADSFDEARAILNDLITAFGRRRSADRAMVHVELALVAKAEGNHGEALEQLKTASKMDVGNPRIQKMVADLSLANGDLDEAERTYRALLLVVRRQRSGDDESAVGVSEVLFELHKIAASREDEEQTKELLESALEAAVESDVEVRRLRRSILAHNEPETLLRALNMRLDAATAVDSQARLLTDIARVLDEQLDRPDEALAAQLKALEKIPDRVSLHDHARVLAQKVSQCDRYVDTVERAIDKLRRKKDAPLVATLLMKAGASLEEDTGDFARALAIYQRAETASDQPLPVYFAMARAAAKVGNSEEESRALDALLGLTIADEPSPEQVNALYQLAHIFVESDSRRLQGIELIRQAFASEPRFGQAGRTLQTAAAAEPENSEILALYERVARRSKDGEMLLDFLERRARLPQATPAEVKEAVDLATELDQTERGEALLARAVDAARASDEGILAAIWAVIALADQYTRLGELRPARDLFFELSAVAEADRVGELGLAIAEQAAASADNRPIAAEIYEFLRSIDPSARHIWEPLVMLYRTMGDVEQLQNVIGSTLPTLVDPAERNALRMQHAIHLVDNVADADAAGEVLRDILLDNPDHLEAAALLEKVLRDSGNQAALADFLWHRFDEAKERRNPETIADVAHRLGTLLDSMESPDAIAVYQTALEIAPEDRQLLRAAIDHLGEFAEPRERAQLMERLLAVESEDEVSELTNQLCAIWEEIDDEAGLQRALELGHRGNPNDGSIRGRLEVWYRDHQLWQPLADMMTAEADRLEEPSLAVARLREAAEIYKDMLAAPQAAAELLRRGWELRPGDENLVLELIACLYAATDREGAIAVIDTALAAEETSTGHQVNLRLWRASLRLELDQGAPAIEDLEAAYLLDAEQVGARLVAGLEQHRLRAEEVSDHEGERSATLRLADLYTEMGDPEPARALVTGWVEREPRDRDALYFLRDMDTNNEEWAGVVATCSRLVVIEEGADQIDAALRLAGAADKADLAETARSGLEHVHQTQPDSAEVRDWLRHIYETSGAHRELAALLVADAEHSDDDELRYASYRRAAEVYLHLQDPGAAADPANKARELRPDDHDSTTLAADVLTAAGRVDEAIALLEPAIAAHKRRSPELASLQQRMGHIAAAQGDADGHLAWLRKAFDVDRKSGAIAAELAQLATEVGDYDLALKPLRAITLMDDPGPITRVMALLWEAKIEHARGNHAKAELWAKKALREDPNFAEAQEFLDQITS